MSIDITAVNFQEVIRILFATQDLLEMKQIKQFNVSFIS